MTALLFGLACENLACDLMFLAERCLEIVFQATGKVENRFFRRFLLWIEQGRIAVPADFNAAEQIGFRARHAIKTVRIELCRLAENIGVGVETYTGATTVMHFADIFQSTLRNTARETLPIETAIAGDFHL